jgi:hypothetical protein
MSLVQHLSNRAALVALSSALVVGAGACSSTTKTTTTSTTTTTAAVSTTTGSGSTTSATSGTTTTTAGSAAAHVPTSCSAIPTSLISSYIGAVATTKALPAIGHGVSCEFANAAASSIVIVNIGTGGATGWATLRSISGAGGRTLTTLHGLGAQAFSITHNGVPGGVAVLTSPGAIYSVSSNLPIAKDEALITQLMKL